MPPPGQQGRVYKRRAAFLGAALLAAAVLLWLWLQLAAAPRKIMESASPAPSETRDPRIPVTASSPATVTRATPIPEGFSVGVRLQYDSTDPLVLGKVREYHDALVSGLRAIPGLHLVEDRAVLSGDGPEAFRVMISSIDPINAQLLRSTFSEWGAHVSVEVLTGEEAGTIFGLGMIGDAWKGAPKHLLTRGSLSDQCATLMPCTPDGIAERHVMALRKHVFPRDGSLEQQLEAQFLDATQPESERQRLRNELKSMDIVLSDAMVREALSRLTRPPDTTNAYAQNERLDLLIMLRGQQHEEMVQPLIDLALHDSDVSIRTETIRLLAKDFPENPAVLAAMKNLARDPGDPLQSFAAESLSRISGN